MPRRKNNSIKNQSTNNNSQIKSCDSKSTEDASTSESVLNAQQPNTSCSDIEKAKLEKALKEISKKITLFLKNIPKDGGLIPEHEIKEITTKTLELDEKLKNCNERIDTSKEIENLDWSSDEETPDNLSDNHDKTQETCDNIATVTIAHDSPKSSNSLSKTKTKKKKSRNFASQPESSTQPEAELPAEQSTDEKMNQDSMSQPVPCSSTTPTTEEQFSTKQSSSHDSEEKLEETYEETNEKTTDNPSKHQEEIQELCDNIATVTIAHDSPKSSNSLSKTKTKKKKSRNFASQPESSTQPEAELPAEQSTDEKMNQDSMSQPVPCSSTTPTTEEQFSTKQSSSHDSEEKLEETYEETNEKTTDNPSKHQEEIQELCDNIATVTIAHDSPKSSNSLSKTKTKKKKSRNFASQPESSTQPEAELPAEQSTDEKMNQDSMSQPVPCSSTTPTTEEQFSTKQSSSHDSEEKLEETYEETNEKTTDNPSENQEETQVPCDNIATVTIAHDSPKSNNSLSKTKTKKKKSRNFASQPESSTQPEAELPAEQSTDEKMNQDSMSQPVAGTSATPVKFPVEELCTCYSAGKNLDLIPHIGNLRSGLEVIMKELLELSAKIVSYSKEHSNKEKDLEGILDFNKDRETIEKYILSNHEGSNNKTLLWHDRITFYFLMKSTFLYKANGFLNLESHYITNKKKTLEKPEVELLNKFVEILEEYTNLVIRNARLLTMLKVLTSHTDDLSIIYQDIEVKFQELFPHEIYDILHWIVKSKDNTPKTTELIESLNRNLKTAQIDSLNKNIEVLELNFSSLLHKTFLTILEFYIKKNYSSTWEDYKLSNVYHNFHLDTIKNKKDKNKKDKNEKDKIKAPCLAPHVYIRLLFFDKLLEHLGKKCVGTDELLHTLLTGQKSITDEKQEYFREINIAQRIIEQTYNILKEISSEIEEKPLSPNFRHAIATLPKEHLEEASSELKKATDKLLVIHKTLTEIDRQLETKPFADYIEGTIQEYIESCESFLANNTDLYQEAENSSNIEIKNRTPTELMSHFIKLIDMYAECVGSPEGATKNDIFLRLPSLSKKAKQCLEILQKYEVRNLEILNAALAKQVTIVQHMMKARTIKTLDTICETSLQNIAHELAYILKLRSKHGEIKGLKNYLWAIEKQVNFIEIQEEIIQYVSGKNNHYNSLKELLTPGLKKVLKEFLIKTKEKIDNNPLKEVKKLDKIIRDSIQTSIKEVIGNINSEYSLENKDHMEPMLHNFEKLCSKISKYQDVCQGKPSTSEAPVNNSVTEEDIANNHSKKKSAKDERPYLDKYADNRTKKKTSQQKAEDQKNKIKDSLNFQAGLANAFDKSEPLISQQLRQRISNLTPSTSASATSAVQQDGIIDNVVEKLKKIEKTIDTEGISNLTPSTSTSAAPAVQQDEMISGTETKINIVETEDVNEEKTQSQTHQPSTKVLVSAQDDNSTSIDTFANLSIQEPEKQVHR